MSFSGEAAAAGINAYREGIQAKQKRRADFEDKVMAAVAEKQLESSFPQTVAVVDKQTGQVRQIQVPGGAKVIEGSSLMSPEDIAKRMQAIQGAFGGGQAGGLMPKEFSVNPMTGEVGDIKLGTGAISQDKAGLASLADESIRNIQDVKRTLFPSGEASSFRRDIATASNLPGGGFPGIPEVAPSIPVLGLDKIAGPAQNIFRKMGASLAARQLIQTGVAAREDETRRLYRGFSSNLFSDPQAALNGLNELEDFYRNFLNTMQTGRLNSPQQPQGRSGGQLMVDSQGNKAMVYPDGTIEEIP